MRILSTETLQRIVQRYHGSRVVKFGARLARAYTEAYEHAGYDLAGNGEARVLRILQSADLRVIYDVGANAGDWAAAALHCYPGARIEAFEPIPETAALLHTRLASARLRVHAFALGRKEGEMTFTHYGADHSFLSSGIYHSHVVPGHAINVQVKRGDLVAAALGDARIDLLKCDAEGMDLDVLAGFEPLLRDGLVRIIQFEHECGAHRLREFHDFLHPFGYVLGKIHARRVAFGPYHPADERYAGPNYLAVRATELKLIDLLARSSP